MLLNPGDLRGRGIEALREGVEAYRDIQIATSFYNPQKRRGKTTRAKKKGTNLQQTLETPLRRSLGSTPWEPFAGDTYDVAALWRKLAKTSPKR